MIDMGKLLARIEKDMKFCADTIDKGTDPVHVEAARLSFNLLSHLRMDVVDGYFESEGD